MRGEIYRSLFFACFFFVFSFILSIVYDYLLYPLGNALGLVDVTFDITSFLAVFTLYVIGYFIFYKNNSSLKKDLKVPSKSDYLIFTLLCLPIIFGFDFAWSCFLQLFNFETGLVDTSFNTSFITVLYVGVLGPIMEEIVFRGFICGSIKKYNRYTAIIVSSVLFSCIHLTLEQSFPALIGGIILAFLYLKYNSLIPGILLHMISNFLSLIEIEISLAGNIFILLLGLTILVIGIIKYRKKVLIIIKLFYQSLKELFCVHLSYLFFGFYLLIIIFQIIF